MILTSLRNLPFPLVLFLSLCLCPLQAEESSEKTTLLSPSRLPRAEQLLLPHLERAEKAEVKGNLFESLSTDLSAQPASQSSRVEQIRWHVDYQYGWFSSKLNVQRKLSDGVDEVGTELLLRPTDNIAIGASAKSQVPREMLANPTSVWTRPTLNGTLRWTW